MSKITNQIPKKRPSLFPPGSSYLLVIQEPLRWGVVYHVFLQPPHTQTLQEFVPMKKKILPPESKQT